MLCVFNNLFECGQMFGKIEDRVLRFHSLYHVNVKWDSWTGQSSHLVAKNLRILVYLVIYDSG